MSLGAAYILMTFSATLITNEVHHGVTQDCVVRKPHCIANRLYHGLSHFLRRNLMHPASQPMHFQGTLILAQPQISADMK